MAAAPNTFYQGVIEGFYGQPWTHDQRMRLLRLLKNLRLNTYVYAPKNDLLHRRRWKKPYPKKDLKEFSALGNLARDLDLVLVFSLSPGLNINYSSKADVSVLIEKFQHVQEKGFNGFALLVDDIPDKLNERDRTKFPSLALAHASLANRVYKALDCRHFFLCPTYYSFERCNDLHKLYHYLQELGDALAPGIQVFWTGDETIARNISSSRIQPVAGELQRKPVIWDNYFADDYTANRIFMGPLYGRSATLRTSINGFLLNPSRHFELACLSLISLSEYLKHQALYRPGHAYARMLLQAGGPKYHSLLKAVADLYHGPFRRTALARTLAQCVSEARNKPRNTLIKFLRHRGVKLLKQVWDLEHISNNELYLSVFPFSVQANKLVKAIEYYLRDLIEEPGMHDKLRLELHRMGFEAGDEPEKILLALLG
ncbi:beta-N-acetylglucosaminidase domain-containing protein [Fibrobacterota bacterium]